jgi:hypothetical protein
MRFTAIAVGLVAAVTFVAGCGGSSSSKTGTSAAAPAPSAATTPSGAAASTKSFTSVQNCQQLAGLGTKFAQAMSATTSGGKVDLKNAVNAYQALANAAPSAIRPDLQVTERAFASFAGELSKVGYTPGKAPSPAQLSSLQSAVQVFSQPQIRAAEQHLSAWAHQNCR